MSRSPSVSSDRSSLDAQVRALVAAWPSEAAEQVGVPLCRAAAEASTDRRARARLRVWLALAYRRGLLDAAMCERLRGAVAAVGERGRSAGSPSLSPSLACL